MSDELQNHMNKGMYGTPQINPDERRKYLGTFRERVDVVITFEELNNPESLQMITALISLQRPITVSRMIQPISRLFFATRLKPFTKKKLIFLSATLRKRRIRLSLSIVLSWKDFSTKKEIERKKPRFPLELNIMPNIV